jgi:hypothetical protein
MHVYIYMYILIYIHIHTHGSYVNISLMPFSNEHEGHTCSFTNLSLFLITRETHTPGSQGYLNKSV